MSREDKKRQFHIGAQNDATYIISGEAPALNNDYPRHDADRTCVAKVYDEAEAKRLVDAANAALCGARSAEQHVGTVAHGSRRAEILARSHDQSAERSKDGPTPNTATSEVKPAGAQPPADENAEAVGRGAERQAGSIPAPSARCTLSHALRSEPTSAAYRWIEDACEAMRQALKAEQRGYQERQATAEKMNLLLSGVPVPNEDLGFDSPADRCANSATLRTECQHFPLDETAVKNLADWMNDGDGGLQEVTLHVDGEGQLSVWITEYPEEGAMPLYTPESRGDR